MAGDEVNDTVALLQQNIADALRTELAMLDRPMSEADVPEIAYWLAVNIDKVFDATLKGL